MGLDSPSHGGCATPPWLLSYTTMCQACLRHVRCASTTRIVCHHAPRSCANTPRSCASTCPDSAQAQAPIVRQHAPPQPLADFWRTYVRRTTLKPAVLALQLHARLCKLYPDFDIVHQPSLAPLSDAGGQACQPPEAGAAPAVCEAFVANAATFGDVFKWHVDGDPTCIPDCAWRACPHPTPCMDPAAAAHAPTR